MKARSLVIVLLLTGCGGPEEDLATTQDSVCTVTDDVGNSRECATGLFQPRRAWELTAQDVDWFVFKTGARSKSHIIWTDPTSTALTECWLFRRDIFADVLVAYGKPCYINQTLAGNATTYYLELRGGVEPPATTPSTGHYTFNFYTP